MNETRSKTCWVLKGLLALFGVTYATGVFYFLLGWQRASLPFYACVFGLGVFSVAGALRWKRWGVYGLALTWATTVALNALFPSPISLPSAVATTLLVTLFVWQVRCAWSRFQ